MPIQTAADSINNSAGSPYGFKNRIINGAMVIDQRNAGASITPSNNSFIVDRWKAGITQASKFTAQQNAGSVTPPAGFSNYLGVTSSSSYSALSTDQFYLTQPIEGFNTADLGFGASSASSIAVSFWVRSSLTGTFSGTIGNDAFSRTYAFSFTINSANTWEYETITIPGDTTGTWIGATNGTGIWFTMDLGSGSNYATTANTWTAGGYRKATGSTSVVGTNGATFYITGVQLEKGSQATAFDYRPYGYELDLCYRYYQAIGGGTADATGIGFGAGTTVYVQGPLLKTMRASPTISYTGAQAGLYLTTVSVGGNLAGFSSAGGGVNSFYIYGATNGASYATYSCVHFRVSDGTKLTANAEL